MENAFKTDLHLTLGGVKVNIKFKCANISCDLKALEGNPASSSNPV